MENGEHICFVRTVANIKAILGLRMTEGGACIPMSQVRLLHAFAKLN